ncbi:MAG: ATP-dependent helicase HrpB, partial [Hydrogenovibrio sp.]
HRALHNASSLVLQAEPGAGKSTAVPLSLLSRHAHDQTALGWLGSQKILLMEPRRLAVKTIAAFLATQLDEPVGQTVGYQIRHERQVSSATRLEIVTEGVLTKRLQQDPELKGVGLLIFDEFHERSIHADLALTLALEVQSALREDLKIMIMSATLDADSVMALLQAQGAEVAGLTVPGRCYPVTEHYLAQPLDLTNRAAQLSAVLRQIHQAWQDTDADILVFLPGQAEILRLQERLEAVFNESTWQESGAAVVRPLYGALSAQDQALALVADAQGRRKIVLATNIAETSLTIDGIGAVVDSGLQRKAIYDVVSGMTALTTQRISKASAEQRKGRAGRLSAGQVYRLWTQAQQQALPDYDPPEIQQVDLSDLCLELANWGVQTPDELHWLTPPPRSAYEAARSLLNQLGLMQPGGGLTELGQAASALAGTPRLAAMCLKADKVETLTRVESQTLATDLVGILSERDVLMRYEQADLIQRVLALQHYRESPKSALSAYPLRLAAMRQALKNARSALRVLGVKQPCKPLALSQLQAHCGRLVALAYPDRVARRRPGAQAIASFHMTNGKNAILPEGDPLRNEPWLAVASLDGQRQDGRIFLAAPLMEQDVFSLFADQIETRAYLGLNAQKTELVALEQQWLLKLRLSETPLSNPQPQRFQTALLSLLAQDLSYLPWREKTQAWLNRYNWLARQSRKLVAEGTDSTAIEFPVFDQAWLKAHLSQWLAPYLNGVTSLKALQRLELATLLQHLLSYEQQTLLAQQAPTHYETPSGHRVAIDYSGAYPKVSVILQWMFGEVCSPRLAWGNVPLTFELLSPARRPIQITHDLAGFWQTSYFDVMKEMKGRYPKHRWPLKPLEERPGASVKR